MCMLWIVYTCGLNECACYEWYIHVDQMNVHVVNSIYMDQMNVHVMNSIYMWTKWMCMLWIVYTCGLNECACYE